MRTRMVSVLSAGSVIIGFSCGDGAELAARDVVSRRAPVAAAALPEIRFSELHYDNAGTDTGEAIEIEGPAGTFLTGFRVVLYNGSGGGAYNTQALGGVIPETCDGRGVVVLTYPTNGIQNGSPDGLALVDAGGQVIEFLSYEGMFTAVDGPAAGMSSTDIVAEESSAPVGWSLQRDAADRWQAAAATFGVCNGSGEPPPPGNTVTFSGRASGDPPLPVGFEDQLFATVRDANNAVVPTTITWTSETPALASIDQNGVMTALGAGTAVVRATAADGITTATYALPTRVGVASTTAEYAGNAEFGEPTDADPGDDTVIRHPQYTASYNPGRNTPNWVSYDLDVTHFGAEDRCDCFTFDPALPAAFTRLTTADYTGAGAFHGYGIDRGHLARSFDRTSASLDNAFTYYFTNIVPQAADLNQGPWARLESYLGDLARLQDKEVYIVTGVAGSKGTVKNEGKIVIPARTWKVAVIMPRNRGLADVADYRDLEVVAVDMPNDPGVRDVSWRTYETTVDTIEAASGYDLLALLPDKIEGIVESGIRPPVASAGGPYAASEGSEVALSATGSVDPNGTVVSYAWSFGDGATATGPLVAHTYAQDGVYTVRVVVTDDDGLTDTALATVEVVNVAPSIGDFAGATLLPHEPYTASGAFTDPGADAWTASVDWGDGAGALELTLAGMRFAASHVYVAAGVFTVTLRISDGAASATRTQAVTVLPPAQALQGAIALVDELVAAGKLGGAAGALLRLELEVAQLELERGRLAPARILLRAVRVQLDVLVRLGVLSPGDAAPLQALVARVARSLST